MQLYNTQKWEYDYCMQLYNTQKWEYDYCMQLYNTQKWEYDYCMQLHKSGIIHKSGSTITVCNTKVGVL